MTATENGLQIFAHLPGRRDADFEIIFAERVLRVVAKQSDHADPFESVIDLPPGFDPLSARATYANGSLRIILPKV